MTAYDLITKFDSPNFTPASRVRAVYGMDRKITAITIHHWGIKGQRFQNIVNYLCRKGGNTSAHEVIESGKVAVIVDHKNAAWHSGNAKGNATTIGLELRPEATDGDYATAAQRIADLRKTYGDLPLIPHKSWKATACPGNWDLKRLDREARAIGTGTVKPAGKPKPSVPSAPSTTYAAWVKDLQRNLNLWKSDLPDLRVDGDYGNLTKARVKEWQKRNKGGAYKGIYLDGDAGPLTTKGLGIANAPKK